MLRIRKEEVILNLIKNENEKLGFALQPRIEKMATILNIPSEECKRCISRLCEWGKIEKEGQRIYIP